MVERAESQGFGLCRAQETIDSAKPALQLVPTRAVLVHFLHFVQSADADRVSRAAAALGNFLRGWEFVRIRQVERCPVEDRYRPEPTTRKSNHEAT